MKLVEKLNKRLDSIKSNNSGFSLVELIVVIVILAILMSVSIAGYTKYIGQAKTNTDIQACETIKSVLTNATAEDGVYEELLKKNVDGSVTDNMEIEIIWGKDDVTNAATGASAASHKDQFFSESAGADNGTQRLLWYANKQLTNGLPAPQQSDYKFHVKLTNVGEGACKIEVTCTDATATSGGLADAIATTKPSI